MFSYNSLSVRYKVPGTQYSILPSLFLTKDLFKKIIYFLSSKTTMDPLPDLSTRLKNLLTSKKHTDCSFCIDKTIINCHKLILSSASPVFDAMFYGPLAELKCIEIPDINLLVFQMMLEYIYTDNLETKNIPMEELTELYYCAEKYLISDLIEKCQEQIKTSLRYDNILQAMDTAIYLNLKPLLNICLNFFTLCCLNSCQFSNIILQSETQISKECLNLILRINIKGQNINLITLVKEWCKNECKSIGLDWNNQNHIQMILEGLKIPDEILNDVLNMNSLSISDNSYSSSRFSWTICQRTYYKAVRPFVIGDEIEFLTNINSDRFIMLKSLILNSRMMPCIKNCPAIYTENFYLEISSENQIIHRQKYIIFNVEYNSNVDVIFDKSVILSPDVLFSIKILWDDNGIGSEYPRSILSCCEKTNLCEINFDRGSDGHFLQQQGSILNGIKYAVLN